MRTLLRTLLFSSTANPELIVNGNFSDGTTGWVSTGDSTLATVDGRLVVTSNTTYGHFKPSSAIATKQGKSYLLTFDVLTTNFDGARIGTYSSGSDIGVIIGSGAKTYTTTFVAQSATTYLWFQLGGASGGSCTFDNFSMKKA